MINQYQFNRNIQGAFNTRQYWSRDTSAYIFVQEHKNMMTASLPDYI